jgi:hypothetical protein
VSYHSLSNKLLQKVKKHSVCSSSAHMIIENDAHDVFSVINALNQKKRVKQKSEQASSRGSWKARRCCGFCCLLCLFFMLTSAICVRVIWSLRKFCLHESIQSDYNHTTSGWRKMSFTDMTWETEQSKTQKRQRPAKTTVRSNMILKLSNCHWRLQCLNDHGSW